MYKGLSHVSSQVLWSAASTAPVNMLTGNGAHGVFKSDGTIVSDASNVVAANLLTINNPGGNADVCLLEFWFRLMTGGTCTADQIWRLGVFGQPVRSAAMATTTPTAEFVNLNHPITEATQTLAVAASNFLGASGGVLPNVSGSGVVNEFMGGGAALTFGTGMLFGARTTPAGERAHGIIPIGLTNGVGVPSISGLEKLLILFKTINGAAITATTPAICGFIAAHLYESRD